MFKYALSIRYIDATLLDTLTIDRMASREFINMLLLILIKLTNLDISDNRLTSLTEHHLRANSMLQVLLMNDNPELLIGEKGDINTTTNT